MPQHTQQSIAAVSARKFRQSTGNVLKSTGEGNCMVSALWVEVIPLGKIWAVEVGVPLAELSRSRCTYGK